MNINRLNNKLTSTPCVFEKALTNHQAKCGLARHFCLADREGYSCGDFEASSQCRKLLKNLRENATFVLKSHEIKGPLPHNMEIRVQAGGLIGLLKLLEITAESKESEPEKVDDIHQTLIEIQNKYGALQNLPYSKIIQSIVQFKSRRRRR